VTLNALENDVARITPGGEVTEYDLGPIGASGITGGPEGNLWVTHNGGVTSFSPADPVGTKDPTEIIQIIGSHSIVTGPDGNLWVATDTNLVSIPPGDPEKAKAFPVAGLSPKDIDVAGSRLAIADSGGEPRIVTFAISGGEPFDQKDYKIPGASQGVAGNPSGQIAFSAPLASPEEVGLITPPNDPVTTELLGDPFGVALGIDGAYWFAQFAFDSLTRLTTDNQMTTLGGFSTGSGPRQIAAGPGNTLWVTLQVANKVARVSGLEPPTAGPVAGTTPETQITKGPKKKVKTKRKRAKVKFRFKSPNAGATFECALTKVKKKKKGKPAPKPRFKPCKSPQGYRVPVGKYRFEVRAVLAGVADPTPAKKVFRVVRKR
jgi:virginiamycin B lyase